MSPGGREMLAHVASRCGVEAQASSLQALLAGCSDSAVSRQAQHARLERARGTVAAATVLLAARDPAALAFVLSRDFTWLRPFCADMQFKWPTLVDLLLEVKQAHAESLFETGARVFHDLAQRVDRLDQVDVLRIHSAVLLLFGGPLLYRAEFVAPWHELWQEASRHGLLDNPQLRIRLAALGGWVGADQALIAALSDRHLREAVLADAYCFVRTDTRADVYANTASLLRGARLDPAHCMLPGRSNTTLRKAIDYVRASLRDVRHLRTPGQALYLLTGLQWMEEHALELRRQGVLGPELEVSLKRLRGVWRVQHMEKGRFRSLCEDMPEGPVRERLIAAWKRDAGSAMTALGEPPRVG